MKWKIFFLMLSFLLELNVWGAEKLNQPFINNGGINLSSGPQFSSNNSDFVVYVADPGALSVFEVFSVNTTTKVVTNLTGAPLAPGGQVFNVTIAPNGSRVVFQSDRDVFQRVELFSVPIQGGATVRLNANFPANNRDVISYKVSLDSSRVVFVSDKDLDETYELFSVPIAGGVNTQLHPAFNVGGSIDPMNLNDYEISANSQRVVYRVDQNIDEQFEIFSSQITGGGNVKLNGGIDPNADINSFKISPDSSRVVYIGEQQFQSLVELFSVPIIGGANVKLNGNLIGGGSVQSVKISPNSARVVYMADQTTDGVNEIYSTPLLGGANVKINGVLTPGGQVALYEISPNSQRVVYMADQTTDQTVEIYSSSITGGNNVKLNGALVAGGNVKGDFRISPDSLKVFYRADQIIDQRDELFSSSIQGGSNLKLSGPMAGGASGVSSFQITPDNQRVIYRADQNSSTIFELFSSFMNGANNARLNDTLIPLGDVSIFRQSNSNDALVYVADQDVDNTLELYLVRTLPPGISSDLFVQTIIGTNFNYTIQATNGPILGFGANNLPIWATRNNNTISGIPNAIGNFNITLFATNAFGVNSAQLTIQVLNTNVTILSPYNEFNGDFNRDGSYEILAQKKTKVTFIPALEGVPNTSQIISLTKKDKLLAANRFNNTNALVIQNKLTVSLVGISSNYTTLARVGIGSLGSSKAKVVAAGDVNGDGQADIVVQQGKAISAFLSPDFAFSNLVNSASAKPKVVGVLPRISSDEGAMSSLLLQQGKQLFYYDLPTNGFLNNIEAAVPQTGPLLNPKLKVVGVVASSNLISSLLIVSQGKSIGAIPYGNTTFEKALFQKSKNLGKIVGPR